MSDTERRVWLETYCDDLGSYTDAEIANACKRYRQDAANRYFPAPGQLLELMKNPFADTPIERRPFFRADDVFRAKAEAEQAEIEQWTRKQIAAR